MLTERAYTAARAVETSILHRSPMRVAVPDLVSNSYFPVVAAVTLGVCKQEGLDISLELVAPLTDDARPRSTSAR